MDTPLVNSEKFKEIETMKTIKLTSVSSEGMLKEIADQLDTLCVQGCDDYLIRIPKAYGTGYIQSIDFKSGMDLMIFNCSFKNDFKILYQSPDSHALKFSYCLEGNITHKFVDEDEIYEFNEYQSSILSEKKKPHISTFPKNNHLSLIVLQIKKREFNKRFHCYIEKAPKDIKRMFSDDPEDSCYYQGPFSVEIWDLYQKVKKNSLDQFTTRLFMEAFSFHLMVIQLLQFEDDQREDDQKVVLRQYEVEAIHKAALLIEREMENPRTIPELCREIGLNQNKLQSGFQLIFNTSVNEYIHKERLKKAMYLLNNTNASMREIMEQIGLNSQSYFSKIFKIAYGCSPSEFRKIHKKR